LEGPDSYVFGRIVDVTIGPDEHIYVLDAQAQEVRVFDIQGSHVRTIGGAGQGPGELAFPYALAFDESGRLWVADSGNRRFTAFSHTGDLIATYRSPIRGGLSTGQMRLNSQGNLLDRDFVAGLGLAALELVPGEPVTLNDTLPLPTWTPRGFARTAGTENLFVLPPIAAAQHWEFSTAGGVWVGTSDEYVIHHITFHGDTTRTIVLDLEAFPLTEQDRTRQLTWADSVRAEGYLGNVSDLSNAYPHFGRIIAAEDNTLWIYRQTPTESYFDVFDIEGKFISSVRTDVRAGSGGVHPHITSSYVVAVIVDDLGVQYLTVDRIIRSN
jgi:DNA-binding beta-propeller fold protein YncE